LSTIGDRSPIRFVPALAAEWDGDAPGQRFREIDGSLVFVDISGFTNLSERLASHGRIGAEELTEVLNRVFGSMISLGHQRGGHLLKFGGDALLFLFQGADHAVHACSAAVEMRAALRESARIPTSCGRVPLRMSIGVHSGLLHLFLAGGSHRELVVAGPAASTTIAMEGIADAGEIVISTGTRDLLPAGTTTQAKGEGFLLPWRTARAAPAGFHTRRETSAEAIARCLPPILHDHLVRAGIESEHRMAVVSFVKFVGTDDLWVEQGSEAVADALHELVCAVQAATEEQRVTFMASDVDQNGGKLILATGLPTSGEDDERRLLRAVRAVLAADLPLPVKAGVNRGHVFVGEIGTEFRSTFTLMGDTVNLTARLMAAAPPGSIYATSGVLDRSATLFESMPLEPFPVKGKSELVQAYVVGEEIGLREDRSSTELPFRGRNESLAVLEAAARQAADGVSSIIDVVGDAGVGKSRLVREAIAGSSIPSLTFRGELDARANPYRAMRDAARSLFGLRTDIETPLTTQLARTIERLAPHLRPMLPLVATICHLNVDQTPETEAIAPEFRADRAADVVIELVRLLVPGPGILVVEDAQWMDDASAHLLQRISTAAREHGWMFVVTRRPHEGHGFRPEAAQRIELGPLDDVTAADLVIDATAAAPLRPHDVGALVERAAGNPLYLEAMLTAVRERGGSDLPDSLDALLAAQIDALPPLSRTILRYASVLGSSTSTAALRDLLAEEGIDLDDATRQDLRELLVPDGRTRIRFRSVMVRDAAYAGLAFRRRRELHSRAARILASQARPDEVADRLALHHLRAQEYEQAWRFARIAGESAQRAAANEAAALQYEHALTAASHLPGVDDRDLIDVWTRLGDVRVIAGVFDGGLQAYTRAAQLSDGDPLTHAALLLRRARAQERAGRFSDALRSTARIRRVTEAVDGAEPLRARALSFRSAVRSAQERFSDVIPMARAAVAAAEDCGDREALAQALKDLAWANRMLGRPDVESNAQRALALYEELGDLNGQARVHGELGGHEFFSGDWDAALDHYQRAEEAFQTIGDTVRAALQTASIGEIRVSQGRFDDALPYLTVAARTMRASGFSDGAAFAEINLARVHMGRGAIPEAVAILDQVIAEVDRLGLASSSLEASMYRAECDIRLGHPEEGLRRLTESKRAAGQEAAVLGAALARVDALGLAALGETTRALDRLEQGIEIAREQGLVHELALLAAERDRLGSEIDLTERAEAEDLPPRPGVDPSAALQPI
jgi:class 3 adenylate cyclase/tetratricopeptide (TPR) repeat protein